MQRACRDMRTDYEDESLRDRLHFRNAGTTRTEEGKERSACAKSLQHLSMEVHVTEQHFFADQHDSLPHFIPVPSDKSGKRCFDCDYLHVHTSVIFARLTYAQPCSAINMFNKSSATGRVQTRCWLIH